MTKLNQFAFVLALALTTPSMMFAQWGQCPAGQWCGTQPQQQQPAYQPPTQPDPYEEMRRRNEAMAEAERMRQLQNRPMCTYYHKDEFGRTTAVTQPCNSF